MIFATLKGVLNNFEISERSTQNCKIVPVQILRSTQSMKATLSACILSVVQKIQIIR